MIICISDDVLLAFSCWSFPCAAVHLSWLHRNHVELVLSVVLWDPLCVIIIR